MPGASAGPLFCYRFPRRLPAKTLPGRWTTRPLRTSIVIADAAGPEGMTGGIGKIGYAVYGVLIIRIIPNLINHLRGRFGISLPPWYNEMITGMLLLAVVLLQSRMKGRDT